ncbi:MAG: hypothetical protein H6636_10365 [Anaerolineales bacterium]|nr:hypothetical protein [Anaerolineales bacterium]
MPFIPKSHDLNLPDWGPYSKRYAGIAHIPNVRQGLRFDLAVLPGRFRGQMLVPNEKWASGHHAWEATPDLRYYAYRYELEWKDQVFCDVSFSFVSENARLLRCHFVNHTNLAQNLMLHLIASMNFPPVRPYSDEAIRLKTVTLPEGGLWLDALDYDDLQFATPRPQDNLVEDGMLRAEIRAHGLVNGSGIGGFGREAGDWVRYRFGTSHSLRAGVLLARYRLKDRDQIHVRVEGCLATEISLKNTHPDADGFVQTVIPIGPLNSGEHILVFKSLSGASLELDGFALVEAAQVEAVRFSDHVWAHEPRLEPGPTPNSLLLHYADTNTVYGLAWDHPDFRIRQLYHNEIDTLLRYLVPNNYSDVVHGGGEGHFTDLWMRPISLDAHATKTVYSLVCSGTREEVLAALRTFREQTPANHHQTYQLARKNMVALNSLPAGARYAFSQQLLAATELLNVVYPVYTRRQFIRHNTPGKWWDCLYTWDSGLIGIALLQYDQQRALDCLNAYLTDPGDTHAAFILHGTTIPTQIYLFHELWNLTQDPDLLKKFYPGLRQMYLFLAGRLGSSNTRALPSNLLQTWSYFPYDSGGWDDYPAQIHALENLPLARVACAAITAHLIRGAQILSQAAEALGLTEDQTLYREDVAAFTHALQTYAWDPDAGYFSYLVHENDRIEILRTGNGLNFNMGLDGLMPLISGICTPEQETLFWNRLADPQHFWTPIGISTVDQAAPYYRKDGYWNGAVWFPHQWFLWKTALDLGRGDFAWQIARTALELYETEVQASYYCFEHFLIESGRGAGWHQFGGLSSPLAAWFMAYFSPGRLTTGFDIWIEEKHFSADHRALIAQLKTIRFPHTPTILITLQPGASDVLWEGKHIAAQELHPGCLQINLPFSSSTGELIISPKIRSEYHDQ